LAVAKASCSNDRHTDNRNSRQKRPSAGAIISPPGVGSGRGVRSCVVPSGGCGCTANDIRFKEEEFIQKMAENCQKSH
jgi:hypothetical protein